MNLGTVVSAFATLAWIVAIPVIVIAIVIAVVRATRGQSVWGAIGLIIGAIVIPPLASTIGASAVFVRPDERAVVVSAVQAGGYRQEVLTPGLHWIVPFAEIVVRYSIAQQTYTMSNQAVVGQISTDDSVEARTSDAQIVKVDARLVFSLDPERVVETHVNWQNRYVDDLVRPKARGIIRDAVSRFGIEELYSTKRFELSAMIEEALQEVLAEGGLILHDFVLRNIACSPEYAAYVEQKQIAEQAGQAGCDEELD